jgi:hypothetical protein
MKQSVLAAAIAADLPTRRGEVMSSVDLADELHVSENALRLLLSRGGDLPRPAPLPGKGHRWLTRDVAQWLAEHSTAPDAPDAANTDGSLGVQTQSVEQPRRPGRPRTVARTTSATQAQGVDHV